MISKADVIVIGSGGLGAATAFYLSTRKGLSVALIDKHDIGSQTSPRAAGMVSCARKGDLMIRLIFTSKAPVRRNVQIVHDPDREPAYAAQDTKSGMIVMRQQDRERLRSLCEWIGWRVVDGTVAGTGDSAAAAEVTKDQLQTAPGSKGLRSSRAALRA